MIDSVTALEFLRSRRSIRRYRDEPVPKEIISELLEATRYAPSGHNSQGLHFIIVEGRSSLDKVCELVVEWMHELVHAGDDLVRKFHLPGIIKAHERGEDPILRKAPQLVVATAPKRLDAAQSTTYLALEYAELYATTLGLGTCWAGFAHMCAQGSTTLQNFLRIREDREITGMMMVGYPKHHYHRLPERNPASVSWYTENNAA